jgi:hypothetical protein
MKLFTKAQYEQLLKNGSDQNPNRDYPPVVKLFMTGTGCTWLLSELDPEDPDIAFGLCDLGFGSPELGSVSISEIQEAQNTLRMLERDLFFEGEYPLSVYARVASQKGFIVENLKLTP